MSCDQWVHLDNNIKNFNLVQKYIDQIQAFVAYNPAFYIHQYFDNLINEVDIAREELKSKIDNYSDEIIQKIRDNKNEAFTIAENLKGTRVDPTLYMQKYNEDLISLAHQIQFINGSNESKELLLEKSWQTYLEFDDLVINYQKLIMNNKEYYFHVNNEKKVRLFLD